MWILVTNRRVLGLSAAGDLQIEIAQAQFAEFSLRRPTMLGDIALTVRTATGLTVAFGDPSKGDILMLTRALKKFPTAQADVAPVEPAPSDLDREWPPTDPDPAVVNVDLDDLDDSDDVDGSDDGLRFLEGELSGSAANERIATWRSAGVLFGRVNRKEVRALLSVCKSGEHPWLVMGELGAGALAVFDDRLVIAKVRGVMGSAAGTVGSIGGDLVTTILLRDITEVKYHKRLVGGFVEFLTPAHRSWADNYQWGTSRGDPEHLPHSASNMLGFTQYLLKTAVEPMEELAARITKAKRPASQIAEPVPAVAPERTAERSVAAELTELAGLFEQGALTPKEFTQAKAAVLRRS